MAHYRTMYEETDLLYAHELAGKDVTLTIKKAYPDDVVGEQGRKTRKPVLEFVEPKSKKRLVLNKTNGKTVARLYGTDARLWEGKRITLYPTTTQLGGETVECIRIRPVAPDATTIKDAGNG